MVGKKLNWHTVKQQLALLVTNRNARLCKAQLPFCILLEMYVLPDLLDGILWGPNSPVEDAAH